MPAPINRNQQVKYWCFTLNNPEDVAKWYSTESIKEKIKLHDAKYQKIVQYIIWQIEETPTTHRPHVQGYIEYKTRTRLCDVKDLLGNSAHLESRKGTREQARDYCCKEDSRLQGPFQIGKFVFKELSVIKRLEQAHTLIKAGTSVNELADILPDIWHKYRHSLADYQQLQQQPRSNDIQFIVIYGNTGTGKSTYAREQYPYETTYWKASDEDYWEDYTGQINVVLDEFNGYIKFSLLLQLTEIHQQLRVKVKGRSAIMKANTIIAISNNKPSEWYKNLDYSKHNQLYRRITKFIHCIKINDRIEMSYQEAVLLGLG